VRGKSGENTAFDDIYAKSISNIVKFKQPLLSEGTAESYRNWDAAFE
jgi:hypothetical protein